MLEFSQKVTGVWRGFVGYLNTTKVPFDAQGAIQRPFAHTGKEIDYIS